MGDKMTIAHAAPQLTSNPPACRVLAPVEPLLVHASDPHRWRSCIGVGLLVALQLLLTGQLDRWYGTGGVCRRASAR
jgi:hypothetical protein